MPLAFFTIKPIENTGRSNDGPHKVVGSEKLISQNGIAARPYTNATHEALKNTSRYGLYGDGGNITVARVATTNRINLSTWENWKTSINTERARRILPEYEFTLDYTKETEITEEHYQEIKEAIKMGAPEITSGARGRFTNTIFDGEFVDYDEAYTGASSGIDTPDGFVTYDGVRQSAPQPQKRIFSGALTPEEVFTVDSKGNVRYLFYRTDHNLASYAENIDSDAGIPRIRASQFSNLLSALSLANRECICNCNYCTCNCNYCTCNCNYACTCNCNYSDVRLKTNIIFSYTIDKLNVYKFSYIWDKSKTYLGVIAQELIGTKYENALTTDEKGMYMVDYSKLPLKMKEV